VTAYLLHNGQQENIYSKLNLKIVGVINIFLVINIRPEAE